MLTFTEVANFISQFDIYNFIIYSQATIVIIHSTFIQYILKTYILSDTILGVKYTEVKKMNIYP